ncbi:hypothetical protein AMK59_4263 [Oryctes borbonicus]|uniref:Uncharacterized protein n=1 Tax=Oryctes borbonicus TaxID=1629725 RepID=A0A0T6B981_9SCAR|nr:hypothetical protein AMK59_4263 [Oryctes borbonicus]
MYCGETNVIEENFKYMVAASKLFQIRGIQALAADDHYDADESIQIPAPLFLSKKPKYSSTYFPINHLNIAAQPNTEKVSISNDPAFHRRLKRKYMRSEAEKACAKEAAASRLALEALQKELATTDQISSFVIEESCTETTVENFIPHGEEPFMDNLNQLESVPLQVVNYADINQSVLNNSTELINVGKPILANTLLQYDDLNNPQKTPESAAEKLKQILGGNMPSNVEIMFKTSDGNFVSLTDEVLQNITRESLQYQVIDEHGHAGEVQQLTINIKDPVPSNNLPQQEIEEDPIAKYVNPIENITIQGEPIEDAKFDLIPKVLKMDEISSDQSILEAIIENEKREREMKFVTENSLPVLQDPLEEETTLQMEVQTKNFQKIKLDSIRKRINPKKQIKPLSQSERSFCDEFLNTSVDLTEGSKDIYSSDITCIESIDPLSQEGNESNLSSNEIIEERGENSLELGAKRKKLDISLGESSPLLEDYSPRKTRSNKQAEILSPEATIEIKFDENQADKYEIRSRKVPVRKRIK